MNSFEINEIQEVETGRHNPGRLECINVTLALKTAGWTFLRITPVEVSKLHRNTSIRRVVEFKSIAFTTSISSEEQDSWFQAHRLRSS